MQSNFLIQELNMMNMEYLKCQKGGYHSGQFLNIVCLQQACTNNVLCCCACVEQTHQGHKTKTLKKILIEADTLFQNYKQPNQNFKDCPQKNCNTDIMDNLVQNDYKDIVQKFKQLRIKFIQQIDKLEDSIVTYYKNLHHEIKKPQNSVTNLKSSLAQNMESVRGSKNIQSLNVNVVKLLKSIQMVQNVTGKSQIISHRPDQQSYLNYLKNSDNQVNQFVEKKFRNLYRQLVRQTNKMNRIVPRISTLWRNQLFKFSDTLHHACVDVVNPSLIRANVDSIYQMAVMTPAISFVNQPISFKFRVNFNDLEWVAVGVCYKNIIEKNNFQFNFQTANHECYMISGNGGTWSHNDSDFNNCIKSFYFKQGDSVTCAVYQDKICFIKEIHSLLQSGYVYPQRQYYQLRIKPEQKDFLHPCVLSYYKNTQVQYLPSFKSQLGPVDMPSFNYKFSAMSKHSNVILKNDNHAYGGQPTQYKCCILDSPIQDSMPSEQLKSVTFRVTRSTANWIGLGLCHRNVIVSRNYDFDFQFTTHGCYLISSNGGSWSSTDPDYNNLVKAFKFVEGDLVTISLDQTNKIIHFKKGLDKYQLSYQAIAEDKLYPVVVFYFPDDEVEVLPSFQGFL